ncbi:hypothetical protein P154DRAFT_580462 [Amniculicola lignicola CBS 123094]|uniref:Nephrocystin 3-like N-terminal domain-containing protein n=1 Tax=Amniculicola lignicola CBS 123094 TaxID=1392246 RepID=A0A6A5W507_9PLEO|nr:hypothetical protein P154DRAFT_580462 [Amniculicola lignicola CBS 123094]
MDPASIFGVAATAVQFVAFSDALLGGARGVWNVATTRTSSLPLPQMLDQNYTRQRKGYLGYAQEGLDAPEKKRFVRLILAQLSFEDRETREIEIEKAHRETYHWIFDTPVENQKWFSFSAWLQSKELHDRLYWIAGKLGSGKSILIKFICNSDQTRTLLESWSGPDMCILSFYFWKAASSELQMTQQGLVRALLYQAIKKISQARSTLSPNCLESCLLLSDKITLAKSTNLGGDASSI